MNIGASTPGFIQLGTPNSDSRLLWRDGSDLRFTVMQVYETKQVIPALSTVIMDAGGNVLHRMEPDQNIIRRRDGAVTNLDFYLKERHRDELCLHEGTYTLEWTWNGGKSRMALVIQ